MALHCEKIFKKHTEKLFRPIPAPLLSSTKRMDGEQSLPRNEILSINEKMTLTDKIRVLSNEGLSSIVKLIMKECPKGVEEIDSDKIQLKIDFIDRKTYNIVLDSIETWTKTSLPEMTKDKKN